MFMQKAFFFYAFEIIKEDIAHKAKYSCA